MSNIKLSNLEGINLFSESESYMTEISDETGLIFGGLAASKAEKPTIIVNCGNQPSIVIK
jgi:hypothetical protein